ncbi:MAG TPA: murein biosynthesis integral membrane protein MurJ [Geminicoccaceae bacterium]
MGLVRSVATVGSMTLISRVLGFVRDVMIAAILGAGPVADAFFVAFKLPNLLRRLFAEGAFNAGFVPMFARTLEGEGRNRAAEFAEQAQAVLLALLVPIVVLAIPFMPWLILVLAPGFDADGERYPLAVELARITFVYILFISLTALTGGVLNSLGRFAAAAAAPVILNLAMIGGLALSVLWLDLPAHALAWSVALAGVLQWLWLRHQVGREGFRMRIRRPRLTPEVRRLFLLILPGVFGAGVAQVGSLADTFFASLLPAGAISFLYYADRLAQLPLGVIGVAVGTALLPLLARQLRAGEVDAALASQNRAIELALLLTLPAAFALIVLGEPIVHVLFERGAFGAHDTAETARTLAAYALGLPAYVLVKVLAPGFFAREDTVTPVKIALAALIVNVVLMLVLIWPLAQVGIALATALSSWLNALLLAWLLHRDGLLRPDARLRRRTVRIGLATLVMIAVLLGGLALLAPLPAALALALLVALGAGAFFLAAQLLDAFRIGEVRTALGRRTG